MATHLVIPDTQVSPGVPIDHLEWASRYIKEKRPDVVIHLGDHWDMPSLNTYDSPKGTGFEGRRLKNDVYAGNYAFTVLNKGLREENDRLRRNKKELYKPRLVYIEGNHDQRIERVAERDFVYEGLIGRHMFNPVKHGWEYHNLCEIVGIDGVHYSHYFKQPKGPGAIGGQMANRMNKLKFSFTQGHDQGLATYIEELKIGVRLRGLKAGSFYLHDEGYRSPQDTNEWRGLIWKNEVEDGDYDITEISMAYLCKRYTGRKMNRIRASAAGYKPRKFAPECSPHAKAA